MSLHVICYKTWFVFFLSFLDGYCLIENRLCRVPSRLRYDDSIVPYLLLPNVKWPEWLVHDWQGLGAMFDNLRRTVEPDRVEIRVDTNAISVAYVDPQSKLTLEQSVTCTPPEPLVHLIVTRQLQPFVRSCDHKNTGFYRVSKSVGIEKLSCDGSHDSSAKLVFFVELS